MKWHLHVLVLLVLLCIQLSLEWAYPWAIRSGRAGGSGILILSLSMAMLVYSVVLVVIAKGILRRLAVVASYFVLVHVPGWIVDAEQRYKEQYIVPLRQDRPFQEYIERLRSKHLIVATSTSTVSRVIVLDRFGLVGVDEMRRQECKVFGAARPVYMLSTETLQGKRYLEFLTSLPLRAMTLNVFRRPADAPLVLRDDKEGWINDHVYFCFGRIYGRGELADETKDTESDSDSGTGIRMQTNAPLQP